MRKIVIFMITSLLSMSACQVENKQKDFNYNVESFADVQILRYKVHGFEDLTPKQKELIYYLTQAAEQGRDILFDQNNIENLVIRQVLEDIYLNYESNRNTEDFKQFEIYLKRVWFSNGIHHHYSMDKFTPGFSQEFFAEAFSQIFQNKDPYISEFYINELIFNPALFPKRVNQAEGEDLILTSANNYYWGVNQQEVEDFYNAKRNPNDFTPISYGLNNRLIKNEKDELEEQVWKIGGMYSKKIEKIIYWLEKAKAVAENEQQEKVIALLIDYYTTGNLKTFDEYSIAWVQDTNSHIDFINGFIETYGDPLGIKASWESLVNFKNMEASKRAEIISDNAQWFEDNSPVDERFKKKEVKGVSAKVITVAMLGGDCYPASPLGINLPNANWIREMHGSKSVTLDNIADAYDNAARGSGFNEEFMYSQTEIDRRLKYGRLVENLHTDLHEIVGHGSGQLLPGVSQDALGAYGAVIEEARADLFALYYMADLKLVELGLLSNNEAYKAAYYNYMMNGLMTQLVRIELGKDVEQTHMRNRQMVASWVLKNAENAVELVERDDRTFVKINDYEELRRLFGQLLVEIQRIKSEGDYEAAKNLVETLGIKINQDLHSEVLDRYKKLNIAPYRGFVNPVYTPVYDKNGQIIDVTIDYSEGYAEQMLRYSKIHND
jgi:dipeptidyl-peptidase-3